MQGRAAGHPRPHDPTRACAGGVADAAVFAIGIIIITNIRAASLRTGTLATSVLSTTDVEASSACPTTISLIVTAANA